MFVHLPSLTAQDDVVDKGSVTHKEESPVLLGVSKAPVRGKVDVYHQNDFYSQRSEYMYPNECLFGGSAFSSCLSYTHIIDQRGPVCAGSAVSNLVNAFSRFHRYQSSQLGIPFDPETTKFPVIGRDSSKQFHSNNLCSCDSPKAREDGLLCLLCFLYLPNVSIPLTQSTSDVQSIYRGLILEQQIPMYKSCSSALTAAMVKLPHAAVNITQSSVQSMQMNNQAAPTTRTDILQYIANQVLSLKVESSLSYIFPLMFLYTCNNVTDVDIQIRCRLLHIQQQLIHLKVHQEEDSCTPCDYLKLWMNVDVPEQYTLPTSILQRINVPILILLLLCFQINVDFLFVSQLDECNLLDRGVLLLPWIPKELSPVKQAVLSLVGNNSRRQTGYRKLSFNEFTSKLVPGQQKPLRASTGVIGNWALLKVCRNISYGGWTIRDGYENESNVDSNMSDTDVRVCSRVSLGATTNMVYPSIHSTIQSFVLFKGSNKNASSTAQLVDSPNDKARLLELQANAARFHPKLLLEQTIVYMENVCRNPKNQEQYCIAWQVRRDLTVLLQHAGQLSDSPCQSSIASWCYPWLYTDKCTCTGSIVCVCKKEDGFWDFMERSDSIVLPKNQVHEVEEPIDGVYSIIESNLYQDIWTLQTHFITKPNTVLLQHGKNHYSQLYGVREVYVTQSTRKTTRDNVDAYKKLDDGEDEGISLTDKPDMVEECKSTQEMIEEELVESTQQHEGDYMVNYAALYQDEQCQIPEDVPGEEEDVLLSPLVSSAAEPVQKKEKISSKLRKRLEPTVSVPSVTRTTHAGLHLRKQVHVAQRGQYPRWWVDLSELVTVIANSAASYCIIAYTCHDIQNTWDRPSGPPLTREHDTSDQAIETDEEHNACFWKTCHSIYTPLLSQLPQVSHASHQAVYLAEIPSQLSSLADTMCIPRNYHLKGRNQLARQYISGYIQNLLYPLS